MAKLKRLECGNCGGPLVPKTEDQHEFPCDWCGSVSVRDNADTDELLKKVASLLEQNGQVSESLSAGAQVSEYDALVHEYDEHAKQPSFKCEPTTGYYLVKGGIGLLIAASVVAILLTGQNVMNGLCGTLGLMLACLLHLSIGAFVGEIAYLAQPVPEWFSKRRNLLVKIQALPSKEGHPFSWPDEVPLTEADEDDFLSNKLETERADLKKRWMDWLWGIVTITVLLAMMLLYKVYCGSPNGG